MIVLDCGLADSSTFDLWAQVYDAGPNPFLSLEGRLLEAILPKTRGLTVLDAGCGTGRVLSLLKKQGPKYLIGVDNSTEMLRRAEGIEGLDIRYGDCSSLPVEDDSVDCITCSFVASYLPDIDGFAAEVDRVLREGGSLTPTDLHPDTAREFAWKRAFRWQDEEIQIGVEGWSIQCLRETFIARGLKLEVCCEPTFGKTEERIFEQAGKLDEYKKFIERPAIYALLFRKDTAKVTRTDFVYKGARCAFTFEDAALATIAVRNGKIQSMDSREDISRHGETLDLSGYLVLPGLVNAHDHLEFGLFPRLGYGPYENATEWAEDIHCRNAGLIAKYRGLDRDTSVWWGGIRNLLAGVTMVCHHNPLTPTMCRDDFPVRVVKEMRWAHSLAVDGAASQGTEAGDIPFILHAAEGKDAVSAREFRRLCDSGIVDEKTVLVHGLALSADEIEEMNACGASLIACPSSNYFLFAETPSDEKLRGVTHLALGSDSPLTSVGDLLDEIRFAHAAVRLGGDVLYRTVTDAAARILMLRNGEGVLMAGGHADFFAVRDRGCSPASRVVDMSFRDVELVVRGGRIFLAGNSVYQKLTEEQRTGLEAFSVDGELRWVRASLSQLFDKAAAVMKDEALYLAGKEVRRGHG